MKSRQDCICQNTAITLDRAIKVAICCVASAFVWLGGSILLSSAQGSANRLAIAQKRTSLGEALKTIDAGKAVSDAESPSGLGSIGRLQSYIESKAEESGCEVSEFQAGASLLPFLSAYSKQADSSGWGQYQVSTDLHGRIGPVFDTIRSLAQQDVPIELDTLEFSRAEIDHQGNCQVNVHLGLRVLSKGAGA